MKKTIVTTLANGSVLNETVFPQANHGKTFHFADLRVQPLAPPRDAQGIRVKNRRIVARSGGNLERVLSVDHESRRLEKNHGHHLPFASVTSVSDDTAPCKTANNGWRFILAVKNRILPFLQEEIIAGRA